MAGEAPGEALSGEELLAALGALASPYRLRIIAALVGRRQYVSELAREIGMSRPLLHMHLRKLQAAGLIASRLELSDDGKAMNFISLNPFRIELTPEAIARAVATLAEGRDEGEEDAP